jgi:hypothetical protein
MLLTVHYSAESTALSLSDTFSNMSSPRILSAFPECDHQPAAAVVGEREL